MLVALLLGGSGGPAAPTESSKTAVAVLLRGGTKPAEMETGAIVNVPLHINEGDVLKVDTREGTYVERVNS